MEELLKELEDKGCEVVVGWKEKERKKIMSEAMKKLKESNDEKKIKLAKRLARYYGIFHNIGYITTNPDFPFEEDKYGLHYVYCYLENFVDTAKISITGVIKALADDEQRSFLTRGYAKRRNGFLFGLRYANVSLAHSGVESS